MKRAIKYQASTAVSLDGNSVDLNFEKLSGGRERARLRGGGQFHQPDHQYADGRDQGLDVGPGAVGLTAGGASRCRSSPCSRFPAPAWSPNSQRLTAVASNLANANSTGDSTGAPYRAREVVFQAVDDGDDDLRGVGMGGVQVAGVITSNEPERQVYDPGNQFADDSGYVDMPNVSPVEEMVNMISAQQNYQADLEAFNVAKTLLQKTLTI